MTVFFMKKTLFVIWSWKLRSQFQFQMNEKY